MPTIITPTDLETNLYPEIIDQITRTDGTITKRAIESAVQETKMYLSRYNLAALFGTDDEAPLVRDEHLKSIVKDIACWHLVRLSNPGADYAAFRTAYQDAIATLKNIMSGQAQPEGWPYLDTSTAHTLPPGNAIGWDSNPKRNNYY